MNRPGHPRLNRITLLIYVCLLGSSGARAADCWLSVEGSGRMDGKGPDNAYAARTADPSAAAQACWEQVGPNDTMHVAAGEYTAADGTFWRLRISPPHDGSKGFGGFKKLKGAGSVVLEGDRPVPYDPRRAAEGGYWLRIAAGARDVLIENFTVTRVAQGILANQGENFRLRFSDLEFVDTRQNLVIDGRLTHDIRVLNVTGTRYSKRHIRLGGGAHKVLVRDAHADAEFLDGDFAVGFDVENPSHDIEFRDCTARRNRYTLSEYWNGDGFKAENQTRDIRWIGCEAYDNADAGFDIKTEGAFLKNITAERNGRNVRIWGVEKSRLVNVRAADSRQHGGKGASSGIWTRGVLECRRCTVRHNAIQVHTENNTGSGVVRFYDSTFVWRPENGEELFRAEEGTHVELVQSSVRPEPAAVPAP